MRELLLTLVLMLMAAVVSSFGTMYMHYQTLEVPIPDIRNVTIEQGLYDALSYEYSMNGDEFVYCLYGMVNETHAHVTSMYPAYTSSASEEHVIYGMCKPDSDQSSRSYWTQLYIYVAGDDRMGDDVYIGTIHSHPNTNPFLSLQDSYTFGYSHDINMGIISGDDRMIMYTPYNLMDGVMLNVLGEDIR